MFTSPWPRPKLLAGAKLNRRCRGAIGLVIFATGLLGACSAGSGSELPQIASGGAWTSTAADPAPVAPAADDLEAVASAMLDCLQADGLPAVFRPGPDGRSTLVGFDEAIPAFWILPSGDRESTAALSSTQREEAEDHLLAKRANATSGPSVQDSGQSFLYSEINGIDQTDVWGGCVAESGFDDALVYDSFDESGLAAAELAAELAADLAWAQCARDHGWSNIADPLLPADSQQAPLVFVPLDMAEDQLRALLAVCPNFDPEVER